MLGEERGRAGAEGEGAWSGVAGGEGEESGGERERERNALPVQGREGGGGGPCLISVAASCVARELEDAGMFELACNTV